MSRGSSNGSGAGPVVLHVSADFPDPVAPAKTTVIRTLLALTGEAFDHRVISLNRRSPSLASLFASDPVQPFEWGEARIYRAPPWGLLHKAMLLRLGNRLAASLAASPPQLIVGHKLSIEGIAVARAAHRLGVPYAITLQGNTDGKILAARPDLAGTLAEVFHGAAAVFAFAPWTVAEVEARLGRRADPARLVPCPTDLDTPLAPTHSGDALISVFNLRHHGNKNLAGMAAALRQVRQAGGNAQFALVGQGSAADRAACERVLGGIAGASVDSTLDRSQLAPRLNRAIGFVLPSLRESFGLVFIEALFAGLPVIYPKNRAIAGHFDGLPFAIPVDPRSTQEIAAAMARLVAEEAPLKAALAQWQGSDHARQFTRAAIADRFAAGLRQALGDADGLLPSDAG